VNVLVIAPHPDDEAIGCGGSLLVHADEGARVVAVFLTSGEHGMTDLEPAAATTAREREAEQAATILGLADLVFLRGPDGGVRAAVHRVAAALCAVLDRERPDIVYVPHDGEAHDDHAAALTILRAAAAGLPLYEPEVRAYEVWTPLAWPDAVEDVTPVMDRKLEAIRCYGSQLAQLPYDEAALGLGAYRGALTGGCAYAEAFVYESIHGSGGS
jgi:N-acetylglucosamine malate deacetylase 1